MPTARPSASVLAALALIGCGARTGLEVTARDAAPMDAQALECRHDRDCDDGLDCTTDRCRHGRCEHVAKDAVCDDGLFCTGPDRCDTRRGCVSAPPSCDDGIDCTMDACDEGMGACTHTTDDGACPVSHRCDAVRGCVPRALVQDPHSLYNVDLPSGELTFIAPTDVSFTDIALDPDGRLFGVDEFSLYEVDITNGSSRPIANLADHVVALEVAPDGSGLYGAGVHFIAHIDPASGAVTHVGGFPPGWSASGDIAFVGGQLYVTANHGTGRTTEVDSLFAAPLDGSDATPVGSVGFPCVWGLAPLGDTLYGFTCTGWVIRIDVATGAGVLVKGGLSVEFDGAAAR